MTLEEAMRERHSVRSYLEKPLTDEARGDLERYLADLNATSGLDLRLVVEEPLAFDGFLAHYGKFSGVRNYITVCGPKGKDEDAGYYGQKAVLHAQTLGLSTCWVALTFKKQKAMRTADRFYLVIALGYGKDCGKPHKSRKAEDVADIKGAPEWFLQGVEAALLAPTAMNQQKFYFSLKGESVEARAGKGFYTKVDLGIAKLHFELGSGHKVS